MELTYAKESNKQLQAMVSDKDLIIKLLSSKQHNIRTYSDQKSDGVAGSTSISDKEGSPEILVEEPSVGGDVGVGNDRALMGNRELTLKNSKKHPKPKEIIVGTGVENTEGKFRSVSRKAIIHVSRCWKNTTREDVFQHLQKTIQPY